MKFFGRIFSIILALAFAVGCICFSGCGDNNKTDASATETPAPTLDWNTTPDPALFELDEDGHFENEVFSVTWPSILSYKYALLSNSCIYEGYTEDGHKLVLSYTLDEGGEYASEIGGYTAETYQQFLNSANDEDKGDTYFVDEFAYIKIDGHDAMRCIFRYEYQDSNVKILQYAINVNGWILSFAFSITADEFPEYVDASVNGIRFKDGY